jgi:hypothetical protein
MLLHTPPAHLPLCGEPSSPSPVLHTPLIGACFVKESCVAAATHAQHASAGSVSASLHKRPYTPHLAQQAPPGQQQHVSMYIHVQLAQPAQAASAFPHSQHAGMWHQQHCAAIQAQLPACVWHHTTARLMTPLLPPAYLPPAHHLPPAYLHRSAPRLRPRSCCTARYCPATRWPRGEAQGPAQHSTAHCTTPHHMLSRCTATLPHPAPPPLPDPPALLLLPHQLPSTLPHTPTPHTPQVHAGAALGQHHPPALL